MSDMDRPRELANDLVFGKRSHEYAKEGQDISYRMATNMIKEAMAAKNLGVMETNKKTKKMYSDKIAKALQKREFIIESLEHSKGKNQISAVVNELLNYLQEDLKNDAGSFAKMIKAQKTYDQYKKIVSEK